MRSRTATGSRNLQGQWQVTRDTEAMKEFKILGTERQALRKEIPAKKRKPERDTQ